MDRRIAGSGEAILPRENPMKIRSVSIETVTTKSMRYRTVGDWFFTEPGVLKIQVADTGNWIYNMLVAIHELIEVCLCAHKGIEQKSVDAFDMAHEDDEDPGSHPKAPYHDQHMIALSVEMMLSVAFGIKWRPYEYVLEKTFKLTPRRKHR